MSMSNRTAITRWIQGRTGRGSTVRSTFLDNNAGTPSLLSYRQEIGVHVTPLATRGGRRRVPGPDAGGETVCIPVSDPEDTFLFVLESGKCQTATTRRHADMAARRAGDLQVPCVRVKCLDETRANIHREIALKLEDFKSLFYRADRARSYAPVHVYLMWKALYEAYQLALTFRLPIRTIMDMELSMVTLPSQARRFDHILRKVARYVAPRNVTEPFDMSEYKSLAGWQAKNRPVRAET